MFVRMCVPGPVSAAAHWVGGVGEQLFPGERLPDYNISALVDCDQVGGRLAEVKRGDHLTKSVTQPDF